VLNRVLNSSSEPQSSTTTYRSFVQRYRECERNARVQWSIDFNPHPRAWHVVSDDIIYAGSEMNVDTDEFLKSLKSLKSLQGLPVRVLGEEPGLGLPNQHTKACPRFQTMHCWCPPATGPGSRTRKTARITRGPGARGLLVRMVSATCPPILRSTCKAH
jgi:hypothetical protein